MLGVWRCPPRAFFFLLFLTPESPRWLVREGGSTRLASVLNRLARMPAESTRKSARSRRRSTSSITRSEESLFDAKYRKPVLLAVADRHIQPALGHQRAHVLHRHRSSGWPGQGRTRRCCRRGGGRGEPGLFTMAAMLVIDHFGRRKLMLVGSIGYIISLGATAWAFYHYGTEFTTAGSVLVLVEPAGVHRLARVRPGRGDLGLHQRDLPQPRARSRPGPGELHALDDGGGHLVDVPDDRRQIRRARLRVLRRMMVLQLLWVRFVMPETKGVPLEEIQKRLGIE